MSTHNCPIKDCPVGNLPMEILMCRKHWRLLHWDFQKKVYQAWNSLIDEKISWKNYLLIREAAIEQVNEFVSKQERLFK